MHALEETVRHIADALTRRGLTVSAAESCTGGLICRLLTTLPGSSGYFVGGVVAYADEIKARVLGVPRSVLERHGAVSAETARQMAEGVHRVLKTDLAVSSTGNLGPDVLEKKPAGLVYVAATDGRTTQVRELRLSGDRERNREAAALAALDLLASLIS